MKTLPAKIFSILLALACLSCGGANADITAANVIRGNWTPSISFGGNSVGVTYSPVTQYGSYAKIGPVVYATFSMVLTSKGSSVGQVAIGGLPFLPISSVNSSNSYCHIEWAITLLNWIYITGQITPADSNIYLVGTQAAAANLSSVLDTSISNTSQIRGQCQYLTS